MSETYQGLITITDLTDNKSCEIRGVNVFKYSENGEILPANSSVTLTAILSANISGSNWQYKNSLGNFVDFSPITTSDTITINHTDDIFINDIATIKKLTSDESVFDIFTITKIRDGQTGSSPINIVLGNVADVIPCDVNGKLKTDLIINIPFTAYKGTSQISATINKSNITTRPSNLTDDNITITSSTSSSSGNIQFTLYAGSELGDNSGEITLTFTCDGKQVPMKYGWAKSIQAPPGADGKTYYTWIKYADSPTSGMSDNPSGKAYIGIAHNKTSATESTEYSDYTWSLIKGETGAEGNGITTIKQYYARTTTFSKPSAESITSTTMPELDNTYRYLWMKEVIEFTKSENQTTITLIAARGDNGEMSPEQVAQLNKASQDASNAVSKVDNLQVGGRNYVVKQDSFSSTKNGITVDYDGDVYHIHGTNTKTDADYSITQFVNRTNVFEPGTVYTVSTTTPLPSGLYLGINTLNSSGTEIRAASNSYLYGDGNKTSNTFTCTQDTNGAVIGFFGVYASCGTVDVTFKIKLEKGNKATDWTPAPEDMATEEFVTSQGYLTVTSDAITSKVSKNEVISAINQTAESVSINASKINLRGAVTFTSFDNSLQTTINNKAETSELEDVRTVATNAATVATNFMSYNDTDGLIIGNKTSGSWSGYRSQILPTSFNILNASSTVLASYGASKIELGKNSVSSIIEMCGGMARVSARNGGLTNIYSHNGGDNTTLDYNFNESKFKSKVGSNYGFYEFSYSGGVWECSYSGNNAGYVRVNLSDYGITLKTTSVNEHAGITIQYWNGSEATFINADTTKPSRKFILGLAESGTADNPNYASIEIERSEKGNVEHSKITLLTVHDGANVAGIYLNNGNISLDVSGEVLINDIPLDYIVEQGTYIGWKYRKWNSGIAECFGYISLGSISVSAVNNVYRGTATVTLPGIFNDIPSNVHITNGKPLSSVISINGKATDADHMSVYVWKVSSAAADDVCASFHIIGTWK